MFRIPASLAETCRRAPGRRVWLEQLPAAIATIRERWQLSLDAPFDGPEVSCAWVAPALAADGTRAVLKLGMPHLEAEHEGDGLQFWDGDPFVRVLAYDAALGAMLLERCEPGVSLRERPANEQDQVIAAMLSRLHRAPVPQHPFRPLATMIAGWAEETRGAVACWPDPALVEDGLRLMADLATPVPDAVLLATDLHAGNVLRATREPWLAIDPKPFIGDRAYDATQHLLNDRRRLLADPDRTIRGFADRAELDARRVRLWLFARAAAEPRARWDRDDLALARALA